MARRTYTSQRIDKTTHPRPGRQRCQLHVRRNNAGRNAPRRRFNDPSIRRYKRQTNTDRDERPRRSRGKICSVKRLRRSGGQGRHSSLQMMRRKKETRTRREGIVEIPTSKMKTLASKFVSYLYQSMRWKRRTLNDLLQLTKQCGRSRHAETSP